MDAVRQERGDISKMEIRMRKKLEILRKMDMKQDPRKGNPFTKYGNLRNKLLSNQILNEQRLLLQCIKYVVDNNFLD